MAPRILSCCLAALALAGCGAEEEPSGPSGAPATELTVRVDPDGDGGVLMLGHAEVVAQRAAIAAAG